MRINKNTVYRAVLAFTGICILLGIELAILPGNFSANLTLCSVFYIAWLGLNTKLYAYFTRPTIFLFLLVGSVRYVLLPVLILVCMQSTSFDNISKEGCLLYLYEEIVICMFVSCLINRKYARNRKESDTMVSLYQYLFGKSALRKRPDAGLKQENTYLLYYALLLLGVLAIVASPSILSVYHFVLSGSSYSGMRVSSVSGGIWVILFRLGYFLFPCMVSYYFYIAYKRKKTKSRAIAFICVFLFLAMGFNEGSSRNSALVPGMAAFFLLLECFPYNKKQILVYVGGIVVAAFAIMTIAKTTYVSLVSGRQFFSELRSTVNMIESYFAGPSSFGVIIRAKDRFQSAFSLRTWLGDVFGNWPVISQLFDSGNRSTTFFNIAFYGSARAFDQIIPMTGQGAFHFGYVFSVIPLCLSLYFSALFDIRSDKTKDYVRSYIYLFASIRLAMGLISNVSIVSSVISLPLIELLVIAWLSSRIKPLKALKPNTLDHT